MRNANESYSHKVCWNIFRFLIARCARVISCACDYTNRPSQKLITKDLQQTQHGNLPQQHGYGRLH